MIQQESSKRQRLALKRQRARERNRRNGQILNPPNKHAIRKQQNRTAAQRSRDRKKEYYQNLQEQNKIFQEIIGNCEKCSAQHRRYVAEKNNEENFGQERSNRGNSREEGNNREKPSNLLNNRQQGSQNQNKKDCRNGENNIFQEQLVEEQSQQAPIGSSALVQANNNWQRDQPDSQSNLSKYFWLGGFLIVICIFDMYMPIDGSNSIFHQMPLNTNNSATFIPYKQKSAINYSHLTLAYLKMPSHYDDMFQDYNGVMMA